MIINLTQHPGTPEQGVKEPSDKKGVQALLTFSTLPTSAEIRERAEKLAAIAVAEGANAAMIGGAPYLMGPLESALRSAGVKALYAFSVRQSVEKTDGDGNVVKVNVFKHVGFVEAAE
jgi:hypothetical protein